MKNKNTKVLLGIGTSLICVLTTVMLVHNNKLSSSTSIVKNDDDRTFTLDTPLNIDGTIGTLNVDSLAIYASNCSSIENGVAKLNNGRMVIYCPSGFNENSYYYGFSGSTITEVSITYNNNNKARTIYLDWGGMTEGKTVTGGGTGSYSTFATSASNTNQTITTNSSGNFITSKNTNNKKGLEAIYIHTESNQAIDIISVTITYTCK